MGRYHYAGFLEKMLGPLPGQPVAPERFIGDAMLIVPSSEMSILAPV